MKSKINLQNQKIWFLIVGLLLLGVPKLLSNSININSEITDFSTGLGSVFVLASLYFLYKLRNRTTND